MKPNFKMRLNHKMKLNNKPGIRMKPNNKPRIQMKPQAPSSKNKPIKMAFTFAQIQGLISAPEKYTEPVVLLHKRNSLHVTHFTVEVITTMDVLHAQINRMIDISMVTARMVLRDKISQT